MKAGRLKGPLLVAVSIAAALLVACGSGVTPTSLPTATPLPPTPTPTVTPTPMPESTPTPEPAPFDAAGLKLNQRQVFGDFPFSIAFPESWTAESDGPVTFIHQFPENDPGREDGYSVILDHRQVNAMYALGLPEDPTLGDLLELNGGFFGWEVLSSSETVAFGAPALAVEVGQRDGGSGIALMGFVGGEAYLLTINASGDDALDDFRLVWANMLDSIRSEEVALTAEQRYLKRAREALDLANLKFARFDAALNQTYATRERITQSLTEAGAGTVFVETLEALESIDPPVLYREEHRRLVEAHRELARLGRRDGRGRAGGRPGLLRPDQRPGGRGQRLLHSISAGRALPRSFPRPPAMSLAGAAAGRRLRPAARRSTAPV